MASISGQTTSKISGVDGFFTTSGGGITANTMPALGVTGTVSVGNSAIIANSAITPDFNIGSLETERFTKITQGNYSQTDASQLSQLALTSTGELWYNYQPNAQYNSWTTPDGTWYRYGLDSDWTDVSLGSNGSCALAVKNGELWFVGRGSNGQRGDGITTASSVWIMVNNALVWDKVSVGEYFSTALDTNQHAYLSGRQYNFQTAQGTTSGTLTTFTRDKNNLTGVTQVLACVYRTTIFVVGGNIYSSGMNHNYIGGGLHGSTGDVDGPTLGYSGGDIASVASANYWGAMAITLTGQLRFAGNGSHYARPDGSTTSHSSTLTAYDLIDGGATGYTFYQWNGNSSLRTYPALAIKSGVLTMGGGTDSYVMKEALGYPSSTTSWVSVGATGPTTASGGSFLITISW